MKENQQLTVRVQGTGNSRARAFAAALSSIQREILKSNNNMILRLEPLNVEVVSATEKITTEKFLFFFLPREKALCTVILDVTVDVCFVDMGKVSFTSIK